MDSRTSLKTAVILLLSGVFFPISAQPTTDTVRVAGLNASVEIIKDRWGISHIYAETEEDLFFAQGYNAARDRLLNRMAISSPSGASSIIGRREVRQTPGSPVYSNRAQ